MESAPTEPPPTESRPTEGPGSQIRASESERRIELAQTEWRHAWRQSPERNGLGKRIAATAVALALLGTIVGCGVGALADTNYDGWSRSESLTRGGLIGLVFGLTCAAYIVFIMFIGKRRAFSDRYELEESRARLNAAEQEVVDASADTSFNALWVATQKRLDYYHAIATTQSQRSFAYGQVAAFTGLVVVLICTVLAVLADSTSGAIAAGVLGGAGAAMSGYIGSTFLRTQDLAAAQMRDYFGQPLEFSRFLSAERLLDDISDQGRREEATVALVQAIAQMSK